MKILAISAIAALWMVLSGCQTAGDDGMYSAQLAYVYDYGEPVPTESGMYRSGQAVLEGVIEAEDALVGGVKNSMDQVDIKRLGLEFELMLRRLYQKSLYEEEQCLGG